MSTHYHTPFKIDVTDVTRVTTLAKHPVLLALVSVTRLRNHPNTFCYAALMCNEAIAPRPLRAAVSRAWSQRDSRWFCLRLTGRGIESCTTSEMLGDG